MTIKAAGFISLPKLHPHIPSDSLKYSVSAKYEL